MQEEASERLTVLDASETTTWEEEVNGALDVAVESVDRTISSVSTLDTPTERDGNSSDAGSVELSEQHAQESQQGPLDLPTSHDSPHDGLHPSQNSQPEPPFHHDMEGISHSRSTIRSTIDNNPPSARRIPLENRIRSKIASSDTVVPIWRPYYLRRRVLTIFILVFAVSIISIETLFALSDQLHGLGKVYARLHYTWKYGPAAVFTVLAALWSRVEFQAQVAAPWWRLSKGPAPAEKTLLLDYLDMMAPKALWKAWKNHDWAVVYAILVTFSLTAVMLLSTTLINLSPVETSEPIPVQVQNSFVGNWSRLSTSLPDQGGVWLTILGLLNNSITYPLGTSQSVAYPRFRPSSTSSLDYHFIANGLSFDAPCHPAELVSVVAGSENFGTENDPINISTVRTSIRLDDCDVDLGRVEFYGERYLSHYARGQCGNKEVLGLVNLELVASNVTSNATSNFTDAHPILPPIRSSQILCFPSYQVGQLGISASGDIAQRISPIETDATAMLPNVTAGDFVSVLLGRGAPYCGYLGKILPEICPSSSRAEFPVSWEPWLVMGLLLDSSPPTIVSMFNSSMLQSATTHILQQMSVLLANEYLTASAHDSVTGTAATSEDRLLIQPVAAHIIAGLLAVSLLLACFLKANITTNGPLPDLPNTTLGLAVLFCHPNSQELLSRLAEHGHASETLAKYYLHSTTYPYPAKAQCSDTAPLAATHLERYAVAISRAPTTEIDHPKKPLHSNKGRGPVVLSRGPRLFLSLSIVAIIATLEICLRRSHSLIGLADISGAQPWDYLWQLVPAAILTLIRLYYSAVDFNIRALQPFDNMRHDGRPFGFTVGTNILDKSLPSILVAEVRSRSFAPLATTLSRLIASLFTVFSASLFYSESMPQISPIQLRATDAFKVSPGAFDTQTKQVITLVMEGNMTYPNSTFEDFVFPKFVTVETDMGNDMAPPTRRVHATVPALRPNFACRLHDLTSNTTVRFEDPDGVPGHTGTVTYVTNIGACQDSHGLGVDTMPDVFYFGEAKTDRGSDCLPGESNDIPAFVWGRASRDDPTSLTSWALLCNETLEVVDVDVSLLGPQLQINPLVPPVARSDSARPAPMVLNKTIPYLVNLYESSFGLNLHEANAMGYFTDPFSLLVNSRFGIPLTDLADASRATAVAESIRFQLGVLRAQALNADHRVAVPAQDPTGGGNTSSVWPDSSLLDVIPATALEIQGRLRVFQDTTSTRILQYLLGTVLLLSLLAWALMPHAARLLPWSATSFGETLALLARGNVWEFLPEKAQNMSDGELGAVLNGCKFRLEVVNTGVNNDDRRQSHGPKEKDFARSVYVIRVFRSDTE